MQSIHGKSILGQLKQILHSTSYRYVSLPFQNHLPEFPRQPYENILSQAIDYWNKTHPKYESKPKALLKLKFFLGN